MKKADSKKSLIHLKYGVERELSPGPPEGQTSGSQSRLSLNFTGGQNGRTEALLLRAHFEKAEFSRKSNKAGNNRRQQKTKI